MGITYIQTFNRLKCCLVVHCHLKNSDWKSLKTPSKYTSISTFLIGLFQTTAEFFKNSNQNSNSVWKYRWLQPKRGPVTHITSTLFILDSVPFPESMHCGKKIRKNELFVHSIVHYFLPTVHILRKVHRVKNEKSWSLRKKQQKFNFMSARQLRSSFTFFCTLSYILQGHPW